LIIYGKCLFSLLVASMKMRNLIEASKIQVASVNSVNILTPVQKLSSPTWLFIFDLIVYSKLLVSSTFHLLCI